MSDFNKCSDCYVAEQENKHLQAEIERLRVLLKRAVNPMVTGSVPSFIKLIDDIKKEVYRDE